MTERLKLSVKGVWLIASLSAVVLPIFLPSMRDGSMASSPIAVATLSLFFLSFPSSVFAFIAAAFVSFLLRLDPWSIEAMYMNLVWLFGLGVLQWFWIAPKIFRIGRVLERLEMRDSSGEATLLGAKEGISSGPFPFVETTPLERALKDD